MILDHVRLGASLNSQFNLISNKTLFRMPLFKQDSYSHGLESFSRWNLADAFHQDSTKYDLVNFREEGPLGSEFDF